MNCMKRFGQVAKAWHRARVPPNVELLRTQDRPPVSEFARYAGPQGSWWKKTALQPAVELR